MLIYIVTRYVIHSEPNNWADRDVPPGEIAYECMVPTYGSCDTENGVIVTSDTRGGYPFFELPRDAVFVVGCDHDKIDGIHCTRQVCPCYVMRCDLHSTGHPEGVCSLVPPEAEAISFATAGVIRGGQMVMVEPKSEPVRQVASAPSLTIHDRCERCGAEAQARLVKDDKVLDFCGHHFHKYEVSLETSGWEVVECRVQPVL